MRIRIVKPDENNIWTLEQVLVWQRKQLDLYKKGSPTYAHHREMVVELEVKILGYYESLDPISQAQMDAAYG